MNPRIIPTGGDLSPPSPAQEAFYLQSAELLSAIDDGFEQMGALANLVASFCMTSQRPDLVLRQLQVMSAQSLNAAMKTVTPASDVRN